MNAIATTIAELRVLIGYLGEKGQANWWGSEFFSTTAAAFLAPIFNRSLFLAQYQGATAAAAKIHDEAIGVGSIYHLFRLPIGIVTWRWRAWLSWRKKQNPHRRVPVR